MIKTEHGLVEVNGTVVDLMADLTCIISMCIEECGLSKEDIDKCVETALKSDDEIRAEIESQFNDLLASLLN